MLVPAIAAGPALVKPNREELAEATGMRLTRLADVIEAAEKLRVAGARTVLASLGGDGAVLVQDDGVWHGEGSVPEPRSSVGAGDAMLAGFLAAGASGPSVLTEALAWAAAATSLGLLLAFLLLGPRQLRPSVPAAMIIQFLGGIHEVYFPYVLMKPRLILAVIASGAAGVFTFMVTGASLVATPAPGSIFAYFAVAPKGDWFGMLAGIVIAAAITFAVAGLLLSFGRREGSAPATKEE